MNPPNREVALFGAALELPPEQRPAYLDKACADDPALRSRLEALLGVHDKALGFLENESSAAQSASAAAIGSAPSAEKPGLLRQNESKAGDRIGRYKLLQQIGEGGCGVVYMAEQEEPVRRRVALKVIKLGMDTKQVIGRFEAERQALALMDHPNIAKLFDAGITERPLTPSLSPSKGERGKPQDGSPLPSDGRGVRGEGCSALPTPHSALSPGRPYFVMELVRGIRITNFCDENSLSTRERLNLFIQICQAIQHAHQKGIIHRDIKPSNILVADHDGVPVPKIIDFGIAKATTDQRLTDKTLFTAFEQFIGTPAYMSPEQAKLSGLDIDTRTDIYSLGVLLYELLTSKTPLDQKELLAAGLDEMRRTIREKEPPRPSTRLSSMAVDDQTTTARHRRTEAPKLIGLLRGDLDWIVMKALEKERTRRYATANGLAMDVQRHLDHEPVVARPPSKVYRFRKLVLRNTLAFAALAAVLLALVAGLAVSSRLFLREKAARQRAVAAEQKALRSESEARVINRFLTEDLLFQATPEENAREKQVTMEEVLKKAARRLEQSAEIAAQPELEATLRLDIGTTYFRLSSLAEAEPHLRRAVELRRSRLGEQNLQTLAAEAQLAEFLVIAKSELNEGTKLAREVWQERTRLLGADHRDTLRSAELYSDALLDSGNYQEAQPIVRQTFQLREHALGPDDLDTIEALGGLGQALSVSGKYAEGEPYLQEALRRFQRKGLPDHLIAMICIKEIAFARVMQGDPDTADKLLSDLIPQAERVLGTNAMRTLQFRRIRARVLAENGRFAEAEALAQSTLDLRSSQTSDLRGTAYTLLYLGRAQVQQGKLAEAEPHLVEALGIFREKVPGKPELVAMTANWLGAIQLARKNYSNAETLLLSGPEHFLDPAVEMTLNERRLAVGHIVELYQATKRPEQAAQWQKKLASLEKPAMKGN